MTAQFPLLIGSIVLGPRAEVRVSLDTFNGRPRIDLRTWCDLSAGPVTTRGPTKKGVSLPAAEISALVAVIRMAETQALDLGLLEKGGAGEA